VLRRVDAHTRARIAEESAAASHRYATLGQYMLDMRHNFNNALTSVLGHAELLLLEPAAFSNEVRDQIETLRSMALRMHEIMQRFSSLDAEMRFVERASHVETQTGSLGFGMSV
jgi:signal transduction histidine kinase